MKKIFLATLLIVFIGLLGCTTGSNKQITELINKIDEIPNIEDITLDHEEYINELVSKYGGLSEEDQSKVNNYNKLVDAIIKLEQIYVYQEELIDEINELISTLPNIDEITISHKAVIERIDSLLNEVVSKLQSEIADLEQFTEIKEKYNELMEIKKIEDLAREIVNLIKSLPDDELLTINDEKLINEIKQQYNTLTENGKKLVSNYNDLLAKEEIVMFLKNHSNFNVNEVLNCISDIASAETNDQLITQGNGYTVEWSSSNEKLYSVESGITEISKMYQKHQKQQVVVTAKIIFDNKDTFEVTKEVEIAPVKYEAMSTTPVATYFQTSALNTYKKYSDRYKEEGTLFSDKAKEVLDIVYYAFAGVNASGELSLYSESVLNELLPLKNNDVRIVLSISGVSSSSSQIFKDLTSTQSKRAKFVSNIVTFLEKYNFDGVDIDWESTADVQVVAKNMNNLMKDLREKLNESQGRGGSPYLLTAAIPATSWGAGSDRFDFATLNNYVDYVNMMSYDLHNPDKASHVSPLYSSSNDNGFGFSCVYGVKLFNGRGLDINKIIIGSAGYGKAYRVSTNSTSLQYPGLGLSGSLTKVEGYDGAFASGTVFYNVINSILEVNKYKQYTEYNNQGELVASYLYNETERIFITYDSAEVMAAKYQYAVDNPGMGIMCWAYTEDTSDNYINSIYDVYIKNK